MAGARNWQEALIDIVKQYPCIYKSDLPLLDKKNRPAAWQAITARMADLGVAQISGGSIDEKLLASKWRNIRDVFHKTFNNFVKDCEENGYDNARAPTWRYWSRLKYMLPHIRTETRLTPELSEALARTFKNDGEGDENEGSDDLLEGLFDETKSAADGISNSMSSVTTEAKTIPMVRLSMKRRSDIEMGRFRPKTKLLTSSPASKVPVVTSTPPSITRVVPDPGLLSEDVLFGEIITKRISKIPDGLVKEKAKLDIMSLLYKASVDSVPPPKTNSSQTDVTAPPIPTIVTIMRPPSKEPVSNQPAAPTEAVEIAATETVE